MQKRNKINAAASNLSTDELMSCYQAGSDFTSNKCNSFTNTIREKKENISSNTTNNRNLVSENSKRTTSYRSRSDVSENGTPINSASSTKVQGNHYKETRVFSIDDIFSLFK